MTITNGVLGDHNATLGLDSNDGRSPGQAWQTIARRALAAGGTLDVAAESGGGVR